MSKNITLNAKITNKPQPSSVFLHAWAQLNKDISCKQHGRRRSTEVWTKSVTLWQRPNRHKPQAFRRMSKLMWRRTPTTTTKPHAWRRYYLFASLCTSRPSVFSVRLWTRTTRWSAARLSFLIGWNGQQLAMSECSSISTVVVYIYKTKNHSILQFLLLLFLITPVTIRKLKTTPNN